ncbi:MAG: hypothetical protein ACYTFW_00265 [Planctomycetota bacterium]|jgi:hypothetical protein
MSIQGEVVLAIVGDQGVEYVPIDAEKELSIDIHVQTQPKTLYRISTVNNKLHIKMIEAIDNLLFFLAITIAVILVIVILFSISVLLIPVFVAATAVSFMGLIWLFATEEK